MERLISLTEVNLPNGKYEGRWSAYWLKILEEKIVELPLEQQKVLAEIKTIDGVRGVNCHVELEIRDGLVYEL